MTEKTPTDKRVCETCGKEIPLDFVNPLCWDCYDKLEKSRQQPPPPKEEPKQEPKGETKNGIADPNYQENPEMPDKEQWETNVALFRRNGVMLFGPTRDMYNFIKDYNLNKITEHPQYPKFIWKPKIVDVGAGCGVGSNRLSQEADFVWGIDKNEGSIRFAKECFTRVKNQIYYSTQVTFDVIDIIKDTREFARFDQVVAIEIIEHIEDYKTFLQQIKKFNKVDKKGNPVSQNPTEYWISTPNRNNDHIANDKPKNKYHVREWTAAEFLDVLHEHFVQVELFNSKGEPIPQKEYRTTNHTPLLAKASILK